MKHSKLPLLLLCAMTLAGCVKEEPEDCHITINFGYKGDGNTEIFSEKIDHFDLYVFDENEQVVEGFAPYHPTPAELAAQSMRVYLPTGRSYHAVAVGNMEHSELYSLHEGTVDSTKIMHPGHTILNNAPSDIDTHPHLYLGREGVDIPLTAGTTHTIDFNSSHVDMIVEVAGLPAPSSGPTRQAAVDLSLEHINLPGWTDFNMNCICPRGDLVSHLPAGEWNAERGAYVFSYQVMRDLKGGKNTLGSYIHLYDGDRALLGNNPINVEQFIQEHLMPNPDFPGPYDENGVLLHEAYVPIRIDIPEPGDGSQNVEFTVTVPDWVLQDVIPEF